MFTWFDKPYAYAYAFYAYFARAVYNPSVWLITHVHVLFRNAHLTNDFNFDVTGFKHMGVEVEVGFATSLVLVLRSDITWVL